MFFINILDSLMAPAWCIIWPCIQYIADAASMAGVWLIHWPVQLVWPVRPVHGLCKPSFCYSCSVTDMCLMAFSRITCVGRHQNRKVKPIWILMSGVVSAEQYINHLHLAPHRWPCQLLIIQFLQARCCSWCQANNVKALKANKTRHRASTSTCWHFAFGAMLS